MHEIQSEEEFRSLVLENEKPVLVDFFAPWCGPCRILGPILERVAPDYPEFLIVKLNTDNLQKIALDLGIRALPTCVIFWAKDIAVTMVGFKSEHEIRNKLDQVLVQISLKSNPDTEPDVEQSTSSGAD